MRFYDQSNHRLVYIEQAATPEYWSSQWEDEKLKQSILAGNKERFVFPTTAKYLPKGSKILEGGCGKGQFVYSLQSRGYEALGVDFAEVTIKKIHQTLPELPVQIGDVRKLDFLDNTFDGYWSLGVIEHFPDGYEAIAREMHRVLKPEGYLFLTFPYMSPLRRFKAWLGAYPHLTPLSDMKHFYQFALDHKRVIKSLLPLGFDLVTTQPYEGFKGFKDESGFMRPLFQKLYNQKNIVAQGLIYILAKFLAPFSGHTILLILKKKKL